MQKVQVAAARPSDFLLNFIGLNPIVNLDESLLENNVVKSPSKCKRRDVWVCKATYNKCKLIGS